MDIYRGLPWKGPMDGVEACIKQTIEDTIAYNPNGIIRNREELTQYMPELSNIFILTLNEDDVNSYRELLSDMDDLKIIKPRVFGISKVHENFIVKKKMEFYNGKRFPPITTMLKLR